MTRENVQNLRSKIISNPSFEMANEHIMTGAVPRYDSERLRDSKEDRKCSRNVYGIISDEQG